MTDYQKILEEFRTHYHAKYDINFDDEILYFFVRVNEMQIDLKKDIRNLPKVTFKTGWDYFLFGIGKSFIPSLMITAFLLSLFCINGAKKQSQLLIPVGVTMKNNIQYLELKTDTTFYYLPIQNR